MSDRPVFGRDVPDAAWRPSPIELWESRLGRFLTALRYDELEDLQARAVEDPGWFWAAAVDDLALDWQRRPTTILDARDGIEWARWWGGAAFNYAAACLDRRAAGDPDGPALAWEGEDGTIVRHTNAELRAAVHRAAAALAREGIEAGDRVGVFLPMLPETVVTVLALGRLRAVFTPLFSGYAA